MSSLRSDTTFCFKQGTFLVLHAAPSPRSLRSLGQKRSLRAYRVNETHNYEAFETFRLATYQSFLSKATRRPLLPEAAAPFCSRRDRSRSGRDGCCFKMAKRYILSLVTRRFVSRAHYLKQGVLRPQTKSSRLQLRPSRANIPELAEEAQA